MAPAKTKPHAPTTSPRAAAGVSETGAEFGAALGIAVLGTTAATVYRTTMEREPPEIRGVGAGAGTGDVRTPVPWGSAGEDGEVGGEAPRHGALPGSPFQEKVLLQQ